MALKRTKLLGIQNVTGINTVGILTVGVTQTAGGVGIASTTFLRGVIMHNTGIQPAHRHSTFMTMENQKVQVLQLQLAELLELI